MKKGEGFVFQIQLKSAGTSFVKLSHRNSFENVDISLGNEFNGPAFSLTPEFYFIGSLGASFMAAFIRNLNKKQVQIPMYYCKVTPLLEKKNGDYSFNSISIHSIIMLEEVREKSKIIKALKEAEKGSAVLKALHIPVIYTHEVNLNMPVKRQGITTVYAHFVKGQ